MCAALVETASAKINLTLRVISRRADGYHDLESLVAFADLADTIALEPGSEVALDVSGPFSAASGPAADNLILKALGKLRPQFARVEAGRFRLEKNIPAGAGLGGGSADAAAALRLLARANGLDVKDARFAEAALATGADVPVCLDPRACIMRGVGEQISGPLDMPEFPALLVNPRVTLATREVFAAFSGPRDGQKPLGDVPRSGDKIVEFLDLYGNDLTRAAILCAPVVADVLAALRVLPGVRLVRMSGSGPTCFALFGSPAEAASAARQISAAHDTWWVHSGTIGAGRTGP